MASVPHMLRLRLPERDTVLYPAVSYPTYAMGAALAGCRAARLAPRWSRGVRVRLSSVGGQLAYVVEGAPWLMPVLRSGAFSEVELRPVPTLGAASVVGFGSGSTVPRLVTTQPGG